MVPSGLAASLAGQRLMLVNSGDGGRRMLAVRPVLVSSVDQGTRYLVGAVSIEKYINFEVFLFNSPLRFNLVLPLIQVLSICYYNDLYKSLIYLSLSFLFPKLILFYTMYKIKFK